MKPRVWVSVHDYAEFYGVDPRTVRKWAEAGLVDLIKIAPPGKRPVVRVQNKPPAGIAVKTS